MALETSFATITADELHDLAVAKREEGYRAAQILAVHNDDGSNDLTYSFAKDNLLENYQIKGVAPDDSLPSISDVFLSVFPYENEAHDLFGVKIDGIVIDFEGAFYDLAQQEPMTIISPEMHAARMKAKKAAAAKAAKEARAKAAKEGKDPSELEPKGRHAKPEHDSDADHSSDQALEDKLASMDPEKAAKVKAALEKKKQREADKALEEKLASMDPEKAAKVRAAMEAKKKRESKQAAQDEPSKGKEE